MSEIAACAEACGRMLAGPLSGATQPSSCEWLNAYSCPRPWENASEVWVDAPCFPGVRADADRQTDASSLSEAIRF